ncbi:MAG: phytanoyl-CoA dioxygenase family protein [Pirellula sp.]
MGLKETALVQSFTGIKLVKNNFLNRMGLQVARTYGARWLYNLRPSPVDLSIKNHLQQLRSDGMVVMENFFSPTDFEALKTECLSILANNESRLNTRMHGPTEYSIAVLKEFQDAKQDYIRKFYADPRLYALMQAAEKTKFKMENAHRAIERVRQGKETTQGDPETELHSDIFFHTHKAWLYLTDVTPKDAPLVYVKGSHRLTGKQARHIYKHSCNPKTPSRRVTPDELKAMGWNEMALECKQNTLVVANVCGYHRRSVGQPGGERISLHCSIRLQPFAFWMNG